MRVLNSQDIAAVSGGNMTTIGSYLGYNIGSIADSLSSIVGVSTNYGSYASQIGTGIGLIFKLNITDAQANICSGVNGVVNTFFAAVNDFFTW